MGLLLKVYDTLLTFSHPGRIKNLAAACRLSSIPHILMDWRAGCSQYARATHPDTFDAYQAFWLDTVKYNL